MHYWETQYEGPTRCHWIFEWWLSSAWYLSSVFYFYLSTSHSLLNKIHVIDFSLWSHLHLSLGRGISYYSDLNTHCICLHRYCLQLKQEILFAAKSSSSQGCSAQTEDMPQKTCSNFCLLAGKTCLFWMYRRCYFPFPLKRMQHRIFFHVPCANSCLVWRQIIVLQWVLYFTEIHTSKTDFLTTVTLTIPLTIVSVTSHPLGRHYLMLLGRR